MPFAVLFCILSAFDVRSFVIFVESHLVVLWLVSLPFRLVVVTNSTFYVVVWIEFQSSSPGTFEQFRLTIRNVHFTVPLIDIFSIGIFFVQLWLTVGQEIFVCVQNQRHSRIRGWVPLLPSGQKRDTFEWGRALLYWLFLHLSLISQFGTFILQCHWH